MAIVFKNTFNSGEQIGSSVSFSVNNSAAADFWVLTVTTCEESPYTAVSTVTKPQWGASGGDANDGRFTFRARATHPATMGSVEFWHMKSVPTATNNLIVTLDGTPDYGWFATLQGFTGIDLVTPWDCPENSSATEDTSAIATVTTVTDNAYLIGGIINYNGIAIIPPGGSQVEDTAINAGIDTFVSHKGPITPAGNASISYTFGATERFVIHVGALRPSAGGGGGGGGNIILMGEGLS